MEGINGENVMSFFFLLIRDNDYLAPRNRKIKEKNLVQHVERTF